MKQSITRKTGRKNSHATRSPRVLVVENDHDISRLNSDVLTESGYEVDTVADGVSAWEAIQLARYDLVVIDNEVPNLSGVELMVRIHDAKLALPIIMASRTPSTLELSGHLRLQPDAILLMPYTTAEFLEKVEDVLNRAGGRRVQGDLFQITPRDTRPKNMRF